MPARRMQLQKSTGDAWSRRSSSNALQKGRQGRVNGDLDRRGLRRSHVVGARRLETANRQPGSLRIFTERNREKAQGDVRASSSGHRDAARPSDGRGTGAVTATGSCEGSLSIEGTSGHPEPPVFTDRQRRWPRRSPPLFRPTSPAPSELRAWWHARRCVSAKGAELATGVSEVSSQRAPRVEQARARHRLPRGKKVRGSAFEGEGPKRSRAS